MDGKKVILDPNFHINHQFTENKPRDSLKRRIKYGEQEADKMRKMTGQLCIVHHWTLVKNINIYAYSSATEHI